MLDNGTVIGGTLATTFETADTAIGFYGQPSTLQDVTLATTLELISDTINVAGGGLTLDGGAIVNLTGNTATLAFSGTELLGGSGTGGLDYGCHITDSISGTLTIGIGVVIHGGAAGFGGDIVACQNTEIDNDGTIQADVPQQTLTVTGNNFVNHGTLEP